MSIFGCETVSYSLPLALELKSADLATIVQFFINVISKHKRHGRNQIQGRTWNFCTIKDLVEAFPLLTVKMMRNRISRLVNLGILITGNFNKKKYDRTLWYAFADESLWGIDRIPFIKSPGENDQMDLPLGANGFAPRGKPIPLTYPLTYSSLEEVNDLSKDTKSYKDDMPTPEKRSLTRRKDGSRSLDRPKEKRSSARKPWKELLTPEQRDSFEWLKMQGIDSDEDTLAHWAKTYSLSRLEEVYAETVQKKRKSIGAYMQKLLKSGAIVTTGRVEINRAFAQEFKEFHQWHGMKIYQKYAKVLMPSGAESEIDFNQDPEDFINNLDLKRKNFE